MAKADGMILTALSNDPAMVKCLDLAGIDRIGIDIERLGKRERQAAMPGSRISQHQIEDLILINEVIQYADVFIRINPLHAKTKEELDLVLLYGADVVMLPYFKSSADVRHFIELMEGRAKVVLLLETKEAVADLANILLVPGVSEIMIGLNDLSLSMGLNHPFEVITRGCLEAIAKQVREANVCFGFGGLARVLDDRLPIASDLIYSEYARLGAETAWLSRSFFNVDVLNVLYEVTCLRHRLQFWAAESKQHLESQHQLLTSCVTHLLDEKVA